MTAITDRNEISGRQILSDAAVLAKNIGVYIVALGKRIAHDIARLFASEDREDSEKNGHA